MIVIGPVCESERNMYIVNEMNRPLHLYATFNF